MNEVYDHEIKLVLVGDSNVGKTAMIKRYINNCYKDEHMSTVGIDFYVKYVNIEGEKIKINLWDTAGQERFKTVTSAIYRKADGVVLVYDLSNQDSFNNILTWYEEAKAVCDCSFILVGNKSDLNNDLKVVKLEDANLLCEKLNVSLIETSSKTGLNIDLLFDKITNLSLKNKEHIVHNNKQIINIFKDEEKERLVKNKNKKKCC